MAELEEKDSFKSLDSALGYNFPEVVSEMSEKGENVGLVESGSGKAKKFNSFLRRTNSERHHPKTAKQKHGKSRTFSSIFLKKKVEEKRSSGTSTLETKSSQTKLAGPSALQMECSQKEEMQRLVEENAKLAKSLEEKEDCVAEIEKQMDSLGTKVKDLELELEESRLNNALARGTQREKEILKKRIELMSDDKETLEFHMAFLEEEKTEAEQKVKELIDDVRKWQGKYEKCESDKEIYKKKFLHTKSHAREVISQYIGDVNELIQENRFLIKKGMRGKPKELERIMRVTDEYLQLQAEKNRILESNEILSERLARQEVELEDLKRELGSAVIHLESAGVDWRPAREEGGSEGEEGGTEGRDEQETEDKFCSPREDHPSEESKIEIPLSVASQRPVKKGAGRITVL